MITGLLAWLAVGAQAQMEVCPGPYGNEALLADLDGIDGAFTAFDLDQARERIRSVHRMMLCLEEPVDRSGIARFSRQLALAFFFDQDEDAMKRWSRLTLTVAPDLPWWADIGPEHPFREAVSAMPSPKSAGPEASLLVPKKGAVYWNGQLATNTTAPIETPGLVQVLDKSGAWVQLYWQDGSAWHADLLGEPGVAPDLGKDLEPREPDPRFAEHAGRSLFGQAEVELPVEPPKEIEVDEAAVADAQRGEEAGAYYDPFESARRRAIRRQYSERTSVNDAGDTITTKVEVLTFAREDKSEGKPVTYGIFEYWLQDWPDWKPEAAVAAGRADSTYLSDWQGGRPPMDGSRKPLVWVPATAAQAYCDSFDKVLPPADTAFGDELAWEWRAGPGGVVRRSAKGKLKTENSATVAREDTGFRCVPR